MHDRFEDFIDPNSHFRARIDGFLGRDGQDFFQLSMDGGNVGVRQIDLVDDWHNREPLFMREMHVRHRLRFNSLGCIDNQQRAFTRRERSRHFVGKIDMARRIEQVQPIHLAGFRAIVHRHRMRLDRDPTLALQVH